MTNENQKKIKELVDFANTLDTAYHLCNHTPDEKENLQLREAFRMEIIECLKAAAQLVEQRD